MYNSHVNPTQLVILAIKKIKKLKKKGEKISEVTYDTINSKDLEL